MNDVFEAATRASMLMSKGVSTSNREDNGTGKSCVIC